MYTIVEIYILKFVDLHNYALLALNCNLAVLIYQKHVARDP